MRLQRALQPKFVLSINLKLLTMRTFMIFLVSMLVISATGLSQLDKFKFEIDGEQYLKIRKNSGGFNIIHQHNIQSSMFFGFNSGLNTIEDPGVFNSGKNNTAYGYSTLSSNTTGFQNTVIGSFAMDENISGNANTAMGFGAMKFGETAGSNVGLGQSALYNNIDGFYNVGIGNNALHNANYAQRSIAIGHTAGSNDTSSVDNVYIGYLAGRGTTSPTDGYDRLNNVMIGSLAGAFCETNGNVFLGFEAGRNAKADNQLYITNSATDSISSLIYGQFDNELLRINGDLNIDGLYTMPNTAPTNGQYMRNSGGSLVWVDIDTPWELKVGDDVVYEDGDVGIGIGNPIYRLDVGDNVSNGYVARFHNANTTSASKGIIIQAGANTNPTSSSYYALLLDGNGTNIGGIRGNGAGGTMYSTTSDRRLKQNIKTFDGGLATLSMINPAIYQMKSNPTQDEIGFIAQELQEVLPIAVGGNPNDNVEESPMTVDYGRLTPIIVAAVKEQQTIIEAQQTIINQLTTRLDNKDKQFNQLKAEIIKMQGLVQK